MESALPAPRSIQSRWLAPATAVRSALRPAAFEEPRAIRSKLESSFGELTQSLALMLHRAVLVFTVEGQLLAHGTVPADGDSASGPGSSLEKDWRGRLAIVQNLKASGFEAGACRVVRAGLVERPSGASSYLACPVLAARSLAAVICVDASARIPAESDIQQIRHAALTMGFCLERQERCAELERNLGAVLLEGLLQGRLAESPVQLGLAAAVGIHLENAYRVAIATFHSPDPGERSNCLDTLRAALREIDAPRVFCTAGNGVCFLLPAAAEPQAFWKSCVRPMLSLTVGAASCGMESVAASFKDLQSLLPHARPGHIHTHESLLLPSVLRGDRRAQRAFVASIFGKLAQLRGGRALCRSLATYARLGFHQAQAAKALYVHPNTLRYRIERICEVLEMDLLDAEVRFRVQLASHLWTLDGGEVTSPGSTGG